MPVLSSQHQSLADRIGLNQQITAGKIGEVYQKAEEIWNTLIGQSPIPESARGTLLSRTLSGLFLDSVIERFLRGHV
jgi:hypothetical protein